ncbi:MAG: single-stranded DNA-binding protein [Actinomycetota bacterium]|nr:single-stranded DNA-binding protein [Actinomycetota bacterium]
MDLNLVVIAGRLAAAPEIRVFDGGSTLVRYLVTTRTEEPRRRIDVVPAVLWDADEDATRFERGDRIWIAGSIQRRFWSDDHSRRSRIEVVAHHVQGGVELGLKDNGSIETGMVKDPTPA